MKPTVAALYAAANWNVAKALKILSWEQHEKNHDKALALLAEAGRHFRNADFCRDWARRLVKEAAETARMADSPFAALQGRV